MNLSFDLYYLLFYKGSSKAKMRNNNKETSLSNLPNIHLQGLQLSSQIICPLVFLYLNKPDWQGSEEL